jgi:hypothetical protein
MTSLLVKILNAAALYPQLTALLQAPSGPLRVYDMQLVQGSAFPATVIQQVSGPQIYSFAGRMATLAARMQHTVFGSVPGGENARSVIAAWQSFYDQFNADGITGRVLSPNQCLSPVEMGIAQTAPLTFQIRMDVFIFNNQTQ